MNLYTLDLFSGCGGLTLGFELAGFISALAVEKNQQAATTFNKNHGTEVLVKDITKLSVDEIINKIGNRKITAVCGGPPCEGFSMAGRRNPHDTRNDLFIYLLKYAGLLKAKIIVMENVPGLLSMKKNGVRSIDKILKIFSDYGFIPTYSLLNAQNFGVPQNRKRLFIIGTRNNVCKQIVEDLENHKPQKLVTVWQALSDLPRLRPGEQKIIYKNKLKLNHYQRWMRNKSSKLYNHKAVNHRKKTLQRYSYLGHGQSVNSQWDKIPGEIRPLRRYASRGRRLNPNKPSFTVTSHCLDELVHPYQNRAITPREAARLQSFPDWYRFSGPFVAFHGSAILDKYEQIGDAVPPILAEQIAKTILKYYNKL